MPGLKIFDLRCANFGTKDNVLQIFNDLKIPEPLENNHVKEAIIDYGVFKKGKRSTVESPIPNQHKRCFVSGRIFRFNEEPRRSPGGDLRRGNQITHWSEVAAQFAARLFHTLRVQTASRELHKKFAVRGGKIDKPCIFVLDDVPAKPKIVRGQSELGCKNIHCADRQESKRGVASSKTVNDFVNGAVATRGHDFSISFRCGETCQRFGFAAA